MFLSYLFNLIGRAVFQTSLHGLLGNKMLFCYLFGTVLICGEKNEQNNCPFLFNLKRKNVKSIISKYKNPNHRVAIFCMTAQVRHCWVSSNNPKNTLIIAGMKSKQNLAIIFLKTASAACLTQTVNQQKTT